MTEALCAFCLIDKESGPTSFAVMRRAQRRVAAKKAGHAGTLDPLASGLLVVGFDRATRLLRYLSDLDKVYQGELRLGFVSETYDLSSELIEVERRGVDLDELKAAASELEGAQMQQPPKFSALKVGGRRAYELARKGQDVELAPRQVFIKRFEILDIDRDLVSFEVECSSGTYVRSLVHDLGQKLGTGAVLSSLRRTKVGELDVEDAVVADEADEALKSPVEVLSFLKTVSVGGETVKKIASGAPLSKAEVGAEGTGPFLLVGEDGEVLAVYEEKRPGVIRPAVVVA